MEHTLTVRTVTVSYNAPRALRPVADGPALARGILSAEFQKLDSDAEQFLILIIDGRGRAAGFKRLHTGTGTECLVDVARMFQILLKLGARRFIIAHNHPSTHSDPSHHDIELTMRVARGAVLIGLQLLDSFIFTPDGASVSLRETCAAAFPTGQGGINE